MSEAPHQDPSPVDPQEPTPVFAQVEEPVYTFQGSSPAEEYLEIARIHNREAKQLVEHAHESQTEDRQEEARLLADLARARQERAEEFEKAARGEGGDPIVAEILDWQEDVCHTYTPPTLCFTSKEDAEFVLIPEHMKPRPPGRFALALARLKHGKHSASPPAAAQPKP
ncbi:MAG: hypothetical protein WCA21_01570 [Terracidiphilus sp.]